MTRRYCILWLVLGVLMAMPANVSAQTMPQTGAPALGDAANVLYPVGSRLGLAPPPGLQPSQAFPGFEDRENNVYIHLAEMPPPPDEKAIKNVPPEILGQQGTILERRDEITLANGSKGIMAVMRQEIGGIHLHKWMLLAPIADITAVVSLEIPDKVQDLYPETAIRAALVSTTAREEVPVDEMLRLVPFRLSELAGLRVIRVVPGVSVELTDAAKNDIFDRGRSHLRVWVLPGGPTDPSGRDKFAQVALRRLPPLNALRITGSEPLRISGQAGHELRVEARDPTTGQSLQVVQWLRFGSGGYLQIIAFAPKDHWPEAFTRFRVIRDGITGR